MGRWSGGVDPSQFFLLGWGGCGSWVGWKVFGCSAELSICIRLEGREGCCTS